VISTGTVTETFSGATTQQYLDLVHERHGSRVDWVYAETRTNRTAQSVNIEWLRVVAGQLRLSRFGFQSSWAGFYANKRTSREPAVRSHYHVPTSPTAGCRCPKRGFRTVGTRTGLWTLAFPNLGY